MKICQQNFEGEKWWLCNIEGKWYLSANEKKAYNFLNNTEFQEVENNQIELNSGYYPVINREKEIKLKRIFKK